MRYNKKIFEYRLAAINGKGLQENPPPPNPKYHNERGRLMLIDHIAMMKEVFLMLEVVGTLPTEEEKVLHIKYIIFNEVLSTVNVSHIVSRPIFSG